MRFLELAGITTRMNVFSRLVDILLKRQFFAKSLDFKLSNDENEQVLTWINTLLKQVKSYIDSNLNPAKVNVIDPTKDTFTQPLNVQEILDKYEMSNVDYYRVLSISKDGDLEFHWKRIIPALLIII